MLLKLLLASLSTMGLLVALKTALVATVRADPACWKMPSALTVRLVNVSVGRRTGADCWFKTRVVKEPGKVGKAGRLLSLRRFNVVGVPRMETGPSNRLLASERLTVVPAPATVK